MTSWDACVWAIVLGGIAACTYIKCSRQIHALIDLLRSARASAQVDIVELVRTLDAPPPAPERTVEERLVPVKQRGAHLYSLDMNTHQSADALLAQMQQEVQPRADARRALILKRHATEGGRG